MKAGSYCGKLYGSSLDLWVGGVVLHAAAAKSLQSCPTLNDPMDRSPPGSAVPGILLENPGVGCHCLLRSCTKKEKRRREEAFRAGP